MVSEVEEFLMPILEEKGPIDMLFQQDGAPPHFHKEMDWQGWACHLDTSFT
jgi:hypothetical protein